MSVSSTMIGAAMSVSSADTPPLPIAKSALRICTRVLDDWRALLDGLGAFRYQPLVIKLHPVCRLVLDAIPQRLELLTVQYGLSGLY